MGYLHVYTGNGKGKTTCAVGLAIRAAGAGERVAFLQFDKGFEGKNEHYHERAILRLIPQIDLFFFGMERMMPDGKFRFTNIREDFEQANAGLAKAHELIARRPEQPGREDQTQPVEQRPGDSLPVVLDAAREPDSSLRIETAQIIDHSEDMEREPKRSDLVDLSPKADTSPAQIISLAQMIDPNADMVSDIRDSAGNHGQEEADQNKSPYFLVICDEIITCVGTKLLSEDDIMGLVTEFKQHPNCDLVFTGRSAFPALVEQADLVTEMSLVKHYFYNGVQARKGIEY